MNRMIRRYVPAGLMLALFVSGCAVQPYTGAVKYPDLNIIQSPGHQSVERLVTLLTGWGRVSADHQTAGDRSPQKIDVPLSVFLIEHQGHYVLIDTGVAPELAADPAKYLGGFAAWLARSRLKALIAQPGWDVVSRLKSMGIDPAQVEHVIITHAHFDHTGANRAFLAATFHLSNETLKAGRDGGMLGGYIAGDFPQSMKVEPVDFSGTAPWLTFTGHRDLFGDGSVLLIPLPGHSPGHLGVFVRAKNGPVLLVGDAAYSMRNINEPALIGYLDNREQTWDTLCRLKRLHEQATEIKIIPTHDPDVYRTLPLPPQGL